MHSLFFCFLLFFCVCPVTPALLLFWLQASVGTTLVFQLFGFLPAFVSSDHLKMKVSALVDASTLVFTRIGFNPHHHHHYHHFFLFYFHYNTFPYSNQSQAQLLNWFQMTLMIQVVKQKSHGTGQSPIHNATGRLRRAGALINALKIGALSVRCTSGSLAPHSFLCTTYTLVSTRADPCFVHVVLIHDKWEAPVEGGKNMDIMKRDGKWEHSSVSSWHTLSSFIYISLNSWTRLTKKSVDSLQVEGKR